MNNSKEANLKGIHELLAMNYTKFNEISGIIKPDENGNSNQIDSIDALIYSIHGLEQEYTEIRKCKI